ncbi:hypothetical protein [Thalassobacillus sp. C254]|uniref:hypothetical protein n=1 Tax=Thalassobacillus sp. C254 TaxID=1225341 RepID=UPI0012EDCA06|nr:hypothetical protein [Thalassobacillus sp. C254]
MRPIEFLSKEDKKIYKDTKALIDVCTTTEQLQLCEKILDTLMKKAVKAYREGVK